MSILNILDRLNLEHDTFSKGQKRISGYITRHYDKAAFMTVAALSRRVGVSESTIVRFAYAMGYDGYPGMQRDLQDAIQNKMTTVQRLSLMEGLSSEEIMNASFKTDINNLRVTRDRIEPEKIDKIVDIVSKARRVYILGTRSSGPLAEFLQYYMSYMFDNLHLIRPGGNDVFSQILTAGEEDAAIAISFPRYSMHTMELMNVLKDRKCRIVAITDSDCSPPARMADYTLCAKSDMNSFVDSFAASLSLINVLLILLGLKRKGVLLHNFVQLEDMWLQNEVYAKNPKKRNMEKSDG